LWLLPPKQYTRITSPRSPPFAVLINTFLSQQCPLHLC
jgi:hypothetical protein